MASANNFNAYSSDYTRITDCLFAIQALEASGSLNTQTELLRLLRLLEQDVLKKLYVITVRVLKVVTNPDSTVYIGGDFSEKNFSEKDFNIGALVINPPSNRDYFYGDFDREDFLSNDFYVGYLETSGKGYSTIFKSILNMLDEINNYREDTFSEEDRYALNEALEALLAAFKVIKDLLTQLALNPCGLDDTYLNNTGGIYLQAAGSDGANGIAQGIHLRWSLTGVLGDNHLPKGDYYNAQNSQLSGFNRKDDYVKVFRTQYINAPTISIDFEFNRPVINFKDRQWIYTVNNNFNGHKITNRVKLTFENANAYSELGRTIDPLLDYYRFLSSYNEIITLEIEGKTSYSVGFHFNNTSNEKAVLKVKMLSQIVNEPDNTIEVRKTMLLDTLGDIFEFAKADNIAKISIKKSANAVIENFYFSTYHDFLTTRQETDWMEVGGGFGLSLDDAVVFDRLEDENYPIDHLWPHFNDGTTVKVANYQDKWLTSRADSLSVKEVLNKYLQLSHTNPRAEEMVSNVDQGQQNEGFMISYLDIMNMQALDYHFARMLGLGHIDTVDNDGDYFYQARYTNKSSLNSSGTSTYVYTSLPVTKRDYLLPEKPKMRPVAYQFLGDNDSMNDMLDGNGYANFDYARVVNIGRMPFTDELVGHDFFTNLNAIENQNIFENPKPVFYGLEYRAENQSAYVKPEITSGSFPGEHQYYAYDNANPQGVLETQPLRDDVLSLFTHFEKQPGKHFYAIYGINWFSRVSALSDEVHTDATEFAAVNTLLPPSDVTVQYVQKEDPLLFTTTAEQNWLAGRKQVFEGQDIGFTRVTFNWLDILDATRLIDQSAVQLNTLIKADHVKAYFNPELPLIITGQIKDIIHESDEKMIRLIVGSYKQIDGTLITPNVASGDFFRFSNSLLTTPNGKYRVENVVNGSTGIEIIIEGISESGVVDDENEAGSYSTQKFATFPEIGSRFSVAENLSNPANWDPVTESVQLKSFADANNPRIERITDSEGKETIYWVGGIHNQATVTPLFGAEYPDGLLGYYKIKFDGTGNLNDHPQINLPFDVNDPNKNSPDQLRQAHVEWYKGLIRIPTVNADPEPKLLEVIRIEETHPVELYVYDPGYQEDPIRVSDPTALTVSVNFHPGYRVYFFPEPGPNHTFNATNILPFGSDNDKRTQLGLQTIDSRAESNNSISDVSVPAILLAHKIEEPAQFEAPGTFGLKVRPDATGKASFTFDVKIEPTINGIKRTPFGFMFYRTTNEDVLEALYKPATITQILKALADLEEDLFYSQRYLELVNLTFNPANTDSFKIFPAIPNAYGFPKPDKVGLVDETHDSLELKKLKYFAAIQETLLPLTEQPPILAFIKQGLQTENALPVIRDLDGNLLDGTDTAFNPFPMIRQYNKPSQPNTTYIRFTDYFLSGASRKLYFFAGVEVTNQLEPSLLSPFAGPVSILQTLPSAPPLVTRFAINLDSFSAESGASVVFNIAPISPEDRISKIRIYRSKDKDKTVTLQGMEYHVDHNILAEDMEGYEINDDFSDLTVAPLGDTVYYRLAGIRTIINEKEQEEEVLSLGTDIIPITLPDYLNPEAPELTYHAAENKLSWPATAHNANYYVYKQNNRGNWEKVYSVEPPTSSTEMEYILPEPLLTVDEDGDKLYYRFKVQVQNTSGLVNLTDKELTV
ncbi:hypothetical protein [Pedobacter alluvionis]|uniref:Uncharacterized protein n=1 Tax=Pedobacter alluvionis TaxID=475253 RepID=A0A497YC85_9SPHI|nr:hypothetical protein [Pedobacter alluvionis]RLJ80521.1 hypothetical protein BCL90_1303 [Pedobacter alluvionis]TFB31791.1 hypothetical protein E3V97_14520 [Pedobacter alluvionis]